MTDTSTPKLYAALVAAQSAVQAVGKASTNTHHKYAYASMDDLIAEAGRALSGAGLAVVTRGWRVEPARGAADADGEIRLVEHARVECTYQLVHQSGESLEPVTVTVPSIPDKGRPEDKAEAAARTFALGYFLRDLLLIPRVDAASQPDARNDQNYTPPAPSAGPAKTDESWARKSIEITDGIEKALRAAPTDAALVDASKPAKKALTDQAITKAQFDHLAAVFVERRRALADQPAAQPAQGAA